jgi:Tfp pilus assembly protein PilF
VAIIYSSGGKKDKAEEYYRLAYLKEPENILWMNNLGFFLINENRNVEEGLSFIDKAMKIRQDDYSLLESKGWGLYKKGKYDEALELMRKSWDQRMQSSRYDHASYLRLEEVKKAAAGQN